MLTCTGKKCTILAFVKKKSHFMHKIQKKKTKTKTEENYHNTYDFNQ